MTGTVTGTGISCSTGCTGTHYYGTSVTLTATEGTGSHLASWSGCDVVDGNQCTITMTGDRSIAVMFTLNQHTLTAIKTGTGSGTVSATGLFCVGNICTGTYNYSDTVNINLTAGTKSIFDGWCGCDSAMDNVCTVLINSDRNVSAGLHLEYAVTVTLEGTGGGRITSTPSGIDCEPTCNDTFVVGTPIRFTAQPYDGSVFAYWSGGCTGTTDACELTMTDDIAVTAHFVPYGTNKYNLKVKRINKNKGDGTVTSTDGNIDCGDACSYAYYKDTIVTLSAEANEGSTFIGWKPDALECIGTDPCTVTIDKAKTVQAIFVGDYTLKVTTRSKKKGTGTVTSIPIGINCTTGSKENCAALSDMEKR